MNRSLYLRAPRWRGVGFCGYLVGLALLAGGCGIPMSEVTGTVTFNGKALPGGTISFYSAASKGAPAQGRIDESGNYRVKAPVGDCQVFIDNRDLKPNQGGPVGSGIEGKTDAKVDPRTKGVAKMPPTDMMKKMREQSGAPPAVADTPKGGSYVEIPSKYYAAGTSGLTFTVKSGGNKYDIELK